MVRHQDASLYEKFEDDRRFEEERKKRRSRPAGFDEDEPRGRHQRGLDETHWWASRSPFNDRGRSGSSTHRG